MYRLRDDSEPSAKVPFLRLNCQLPHRNQQAHSLSYPQDIAAIMPAYIRSLPMNHLVVLALYLVWACIPNLAAAFVARAVSLYRNEEYLWPVPDPRAPLSLRNH